jgi:hypothetical protein
MIHHRLSVTVIAAWRDLLATNPGIERMMRPLDIAIFGHVIFPSLVAGMATMRTLYKVLNLSFWPLNCAFSALIGTISSIQKPSA